MSIPVSFTLVPPLGPLGECVSGFQNELVTVFKVFFFFFGGLRIEKQDIVETASFFLPISWEHMPPLKMEMSLLLKV